MQFSKSEIKLHNLRHDATVLSPWYIRLTGVFGGTLRNGALVSDSPALNRGTPLTDVTDDIRQQQRIESPDLGAYETNVNHLAEQIMDWAEAEYPNYFPAIKQIGQYFEYRYRYYPSNGTYLAVKGEDVILHNGRDWQLLKVGTVADFLPNAAAVGY